MRLPTIPTPIPTRTLQLAVWLANPSQTAESDAPRRTNCVEVFSERNMIALENQRCASPQTAIYKAMPLEIALYTDLFALFVSSNRKMTQFEDFVIFSVLPTCSGTSSRQIPTLRSEKS